MRRGKQISQKSLEPSFEFLKRENFFWKNNRLGKYKCFSFMSWFINFDFFSLIGQVFIFSPVSSQMKFSNGHTLTSKSRQGIKGVYIMFNWALEFFKLIKIIDPFIGNPLGSHNNRASIMWSQWINRTRRFEIYPENCIPWNRLGRNSQAGKHCGPSNFNIAQICHESWDSITYGIRIHRISFGRIFMIQVSTGIPMST